MWAGECGFVHGAAFSCRNVLWACEVMELSMSQHQHPQASGSHSPAEATNASADMDTEVFTGKSSWDFKEVGYWHASCLPPVISCSRCP